MDGADAYRLLVRRELAELLELLHLDVSYERASGCHLWRAGSAEPVLDLVGGYGTLLFGHNHPALVRAAVEYLRAERPVHVQGSLRPLTGELAARLSRGRHRVLFANSGAEAVEVAIKHVLLERRGPILALEGAFHGKTLGALQLTASVAFREGFETGLGVLRVPPNDVGALREAFARSRPAALFLELIQGEGGVVPLTAEFVAEARALCTEAALVVDECQTGLGRTGTLLASEHYGLEPDLVVLSKALGGGLAKISAVLIREERYRARLGTVHTSTYAEDDLSAAVALRVLELLTDEVLETCAETGRWLARELSALAARYPDVVAEVRGRGLMLGVELARPSRGFLLRLAGEDLGLIVAGYLFHHHRIRVAPTLSSPWTLRIQPPVITPRAELGRFVAALGDVCEKLRGGDAVGLTRYFLPGRASTPRDVRPGWLVACDDPPAATPRVGWLFHLNHAGDVIRAEPGFAALTARQRDEYLRHIERRITPVVVSSVDVASRTGGRVRFDAILLPVTAARVRELLGARETAWLRALVERGVEVAEELGCGVVSLGQYTSVATLNGVALRPGRTGMTTGNAYAVALALEAIERAVPDLHRRAAAVVGASGNIGGIASALLARRCAALTLIGRDTPASIARMEGLGLPEARISTDPGDCRDADVVLVAVSTPAAPVRGEHLAPGALVCDLSVPAGVDVRRRPDVRLLRGGIARLPHGEALGIPGFPLAPGLAFACMAEGMLLALEGIRDRSFTGALTPAHVDRITAIARRHGFALGESGTAPVREGARVRA